MLIGSFLHALDAKGRVFIPAKWRETLGDLLILTVGLLGDGGGSCLYGMSVTEWDTLSNRLSALPIADISGQAVRRKLYSLAAACETDKQGRILIPVNLREQARLERDVTLIGVGNRIEIWDPEQLSAHRMQADGMYREALGHLAQMGI